MDGIYFSRQQRLKARLENDEISVEKFWAHDIAEYYVWTAIWYLFLFALIYGLNKGYKTNTKLLIGAVGAGVVAGVYFQNVKKDKEIKELKKIQAAKATKPE